MFGQSIFRRSFLAALAVLALSPLVPAWAAPSAAEMTTMLKTIDDRTMNSGDYKSLVYIQRQERDKSEVVYQAVVYRGDELDKLVILFLKP